MYINNACAQLAAVRAVRIHRTRVRVPFSRFTNTLVHMKDGPELRHHIVPVFIWVVDRGPLLYLSLIVPFYFPET